jgi:hypothetical protein
MEMIERSAAGGLGAMALNRLRRNICAEHVP